MGNMVDAFGAQVPVIWRSYDVTGTMQRAFRNGFVGTVAAKSV
ncbi:hypothetical protein [Mesorhizobium sp. ANAO-SY3R2]